MFGLALILSFAGLALGPLLLLVVRSRSRGGQAAGALIDGLMLALVPGLIALRIGPHLVEELGATAIALMALGFAAIWALERRSRDAERVGRATLFSAMLVHSVTDGAGLSVAFASGEGAAGPLLAAAIVLHRLPEGLVIAARFSPVVGLGGASLRVAALGAATVVGALLGRELLERVPEAALEAVVAVGLGVMLRMSLHGAHGPRADGGRAWGGVGFLAGVGAALAVPDKDALLSRAQHGELSLVESVGPLFIETAPSMLLGLLLASLLPLLLHQRVTGWLRGGSRPEQALKGMAFGLPLPLCTCGVLPMLRKLLLAGTPAAAAIAFAVATPELDVGSFVLSARLLGVPFTVARLVASFVLAFVVALVVAAAAGDVAPLTPPPPSALPASDVPPPPLGARLRAALEDAYGSSLDHLAAWYVGGLVLAGVFEASVPPEVALRLPPPFDVVAASMVAIPVYVCAQGATPLAAILVHKGFSVGAALAFLLVGPGTNLVVLALVGRALGRRAALAFAVASTLVATALGLALNSVLSLGVVPPVHGLVDHDHGVVEYVAAAVLGLLLLRSLLRLGPRAWFANMSLDAHDHADGHDHHHGHDHGHDHDHDHGHDHHDHGHGHHDHGHEHHDHGHEHGHHEGSCEGGCDHDPHRR